MVNSELSTVYRKKQETVKLLIRVFNDPERCPLNPVL